VNDRYSRTRLRAGTRAPPRFGHVTGAGLVHPPTSLPEQRFLLDGLADAERSPQHPCPTHPPGPRSEQPERRGG